MYNVKVSSLFLFFVLFSVNKETPVPLFLLLRPPRRSGTSF